MNEGDGTQLRTSPNVPDEVSAMAPSGRTAVSLLVGNTCTRARRGGCGMVVDQPHVLREYALLADGVRGALVGPRGDCAWLCAPGFDGSAVFGSLVGAGGCYEVTPTGRFVWGGYYEPGTLIWRNRWVTGDSNVECREALAMPPDPHRLVLLRRIVAVRGPSRVHIRLAPRAEFGQHALTDLS